MDAFAYAKRIEEGYARRWIRRNWWRALTMAGWIAAGILIRAAAAATRPEAWPVGGEIVPAAACWVMAALLAMGEVSPRKRRTRKKGAAAGRDCKRRETAYAGCRFRAGARKPESEAL